MITVAEIKKKSENLYIDFLKSILSEESFFPKTIRSDKSISVDFNEMRSELSEIIQQSKDIKNFGYTITYKKVNTKRHGIQSLPESFSFQTEQDFLKFLHKEREVESYRINTNKILTSFPELIDWVKKYPKKVIDNSQTWESLIKVCQYFKNNPKPNLYIRELPIKVHTKFIENNKGVLLELLSIILPPESVNEDYSTTKDFEKRFGLKFNQSQIRIRILDKVISEKYLSNLTDIEVTEEEFNHLTIPCEKVFILENKTNFSNLMNFLTLPQMKNSIGIFGSGFKVGSLKKATWLNDKEIYYWGDIDTHGLQILSQIKSYFPHTKSFMMDFETLNAFKGEWDKGEPTNVTNLPNLNSEELELFNFVKADNVDTIRLEQEKISQDFVLLSIAKIFG